MFRLMLPFAVGTKRYRVSLRSKLKYVVNYRRCSASWAYFTACLVSEVVTEVMTALYIRPNAYITALKHV
jgi:hypothetical protein